MVRTGLVRYYINDDENKGTYYFGLEGDFVCDYESFLPRQPSSKNIQALEDTVLYIVSNEGLQQIYKEVNKRYIRDN